MKIEDQVKIEVNRGFLCEMKINKQEIIKEITDFENI